VDLVDADGVTITLTALRWQYPPGTDEDDDAWVMVGGRVDLGERAWSFVQPCLTIEEAGELADWLEQGGANGSTLAFLEPNLRFASCGGYDDEVDVRVYFSAESAPPWLRNLDPHGSQRVVALRTSRKRLALAASVWRRELDALPGVRNR
jgi:hypothetical protein